MKKRKDLFFGIHFDLHPKINDKNLGADIDENNIRNLLKRVHPDYVTYDCKGHEGYCGYSSKIGFTAPNIQNDSLKIWRKVTKEEDISLAVHYSGLQDGVCIQNKPEFGVQNQEGRTDGKTAGVFSEYADRYMIPQLDEVVTKYGIDGVWLDAECWGSQLDYSPSARKAWEEYSGESEFPDRNSPKYQDYKAFLRQGFENYVCHWVDELHRLHPDLDCCSNWAYTTMMPKEVKANVSVISGDFDPFLAVDRARTECRYLENTGKDWELLSWGFDLVDGQGACRKPIAQICQEAAVVIMHGGGFMSYFLPTRGGYIPEKMIQTLERVSEFVRAREEFSFRSQPMYEVGILYPTESQLKRSNQVYTWWENRLNEVEGALHLALENQYSTTVLAEHQLEKALPALKLLVVPELTELSNQYVAMIQQYVENGGKLIVLSESADTIFGKELIGAESISCAEELSVLVYEEDKIQTNGNWASVQSITAETLLYRYVGSGTVINSENIDARTEVSPITEQLTQKKTAVTLNRFGRGGVITVWTDFASRYFQNHHPYMREIFKYMADQLGVERTVIAEGSHSLDVSLRKTAKGNTVLHLLNTMNMPVGPTRHFCDEIPSSGEVKIYCKCKKPYKIIQRPENREIPFEYKNGAVKFSSTGFSIHTAFEFMN